MNINRLLPTRVSAIRLMSGVLGMILLIGGQAQSQSAVGQQPGDFATALLQAKPPAKPTFQQILDSFREYDNRFKKLEADYRVSAANGFASAPPGLTGHCCFPDNYSQGVRSLDEISFEYAETARLAGATYKEMVELYGSQIITYINAIEGGEQSAQSIPEFLKPMAAGKGRLEQLETVAEGLIYAGKPKLPLVSSQTQSYCRGEALLTNRRQWKMQP